MTRVGVSKEFTLTSQPQETPTSDRPTPSLPHMILRPSVSEVRKGEKGKSRRENGGAGVGGVSFLTGRRSIQDGRVGGLLV